MGADVVVEELRRLAEGEVGDDPPYLPDALAVVQDLADAREPPAVHEHHAVHELHAALAAGGKDLPHVAGCGRHGLLGQHVLARLGRADEPRLADAGWQGDVNGVHRTVGQQFLVAAQWLRRRIEGGVPLTVGNEPPAALEVPAGDGRQRAVPGVADRQPVLAGDLRRAQDSPSANCRSIVIRPSAFVIHFTAPAPASATAWSFPTVLPETPMAPITVPAGLRMGMPPGKEIRPPFECSMP